MSTQRYSVTPQPIDTLLHWIKIGEISIPEIQRPFVWEATKVRNLLDSLYQGYPVGYLIAWRNPTVKLKDGTLSAGKRILIDGQQRVTALMVALLGREVLTKDYETVRIRIAFHPGQERFEVTNPAIQKDVSWIPDVSDLFSPEAKLLQITKAYATANAGVDEDVLFGTLEKLRKIVNNHVGIIELAEDLDIETVTEIFIRVNSAGAALSQADFAMSKIAANESYGGNELRKAIDYFAISRWPRSFSIAFNPATRPSPNRISSRRCRGSRMLMMTSTTPPTRTCSGWPSPRSSKGAGCRISLHSYLGVISRQSSSRKWLPNNPSLG